MIARNQWSMLAIGCVLLVLVGAFAGYRIAQRRMEKAPIERAGAGTEANRVLFWYDPMQPTQHFDRPGKSPFMDMQLIPKYAGRAANGEAVGLRIDPVALQNLGVRFATVERGPLARSLDAFGSIGFNQRDLAVIQARSSGFVTRVYSRAPGDVIERGAPIVDLLIPDWTGAQTEFISLLKSGDRELIDAARQRLVLLGMSAGLIAGVESNRSPQTSVTVRSPIAGVIQTLDAREGMSVSSGATIASINGLSSVWLESAIPEARAQSVTLGRQVDAHLSAFPGKAFTGHVIAVLPQADAQTRTLRVRIELANDAGDLRPGMFAQVRLESGDAPPVLHVASEAIIRTGSRTIAIVGTDNDRFTPTQLETGGDIDGDTVILSGLSEGQRVVASAQFLIDSEANLEGVLARLESRDGSAKAPAAAEGRQP